MSVVLNVIFQSMASLQRDAPASAAARSHPAGPTEEATCARDLVVGSSRMTWTTGCSAHNVVSFGLTK
jgi:hypothetical protein